VSISYRVIEPKTRMNPCVENQMRTQRTYEGP